MEKPVIEEIKLNKTLNGLGFSAMLYKGGSVKYRRDHFFISTILPGGAAAVDGRLQVGDQLLKVNGQSLIYDEQHFPLLDQPATGLFGVRSQVVGQFPIVKVNAENSGWFTPHGQKFQATIGQAPDHLIYWRWRSKERLTILTYNVCNGQKSWTNH